MPCTRCQENPNFHSFKCIGTTTKGLRVYYSRPYLGIEKRFTESSIPNYIAHLDEASETPWIWIFDTKGLDKLEMPNLVLMRDFYKQIEKRYEDRLMRIFILNMGWKTQIIYNFIYPFLSPIARKHIQPCKSPLELLEIGVHADTVKYVFESVFSLNA